MSTALDHASARQREASDPTVSAFVAASAGSGKTKLLTDRLLRLMLGGADPGRIQCLTFTKAAAAEMALRLNTRLGAWVTCDDAALDAELRALDIAPGPALREAARALFATVLDLPGGMRIGTIHAFCQALLKRFPLEAQLSPHFRVFDEADADLALTDAREAMLSRADTSSARTALARLAGAIGMADFGKLVAALMQDRTRLARLLEAGPEALATAQARVLRAVDPDALMQRAASWDGEGTLREAAHQIAMRETAPKQRVARAILEWLALAPEARIAAWPAWRDIFLTQKGEPRAPSGFLNRTLADAEPWIHEAVLAEMERIGAIEEARRAAEVATMSAALVALALPVAAGYEARKERTGRLDYPDLIGRTLGLLHDPGAGWVLYKLDGGLDHLLLDEVQDTAPEQWHIAAALTAEFFAGEGAARGARSVFAVGDRKQSIYRFQGADPEAFGLWRGRLRARAGAQWRDVPIDVSFRSTEAVLSLVDAVFADPLAQPGVVEPDEPPLRHAPVRAGQAGQVELWPLAPLPDDTAPDPWHPARENRGQMSADRRLAERLADWIAGAVGSLHLPSRGRAMAAGDVLILVRRRAEFGRAMVRALKARGVPVAGLDRMKLTEQPAVADLLALCDTLLLPQDDLSLASVLTSPLGGVSDDSLTDLAAARGPVRLWDTLRARAGERPDWQAAHSFLAALLARVDFIPPSALLAEALGPLGGRARLFARLGPEAAEPVDELLRKALEHEAAHPPALQGFLHWLRRSGAEVKREPEGAGGTVRLMTVHGAKGLQAPVVILPDTTALPPDRTGLVWAHDAVLDAPVPLWAPTADARSERTRLLRQDIRQEDQRELNRLLYVALTRAEDRLIVCGWAGKRALPETCWYEQARRGFMALSATAEPFADWGDRLVFATAQTAAPDRPAIAQAARHRTAPPAWAGQAPLWRPAPPPAEPALPEPLAPSRPEGADLGPVPGAASPLLARDTAGLRFRRGTLLHALLQHLPGLPDPAAAARRWLSGPAHGLPAEEADALAAEALTVLAHPTLAPLFGPQGRAEVPLTGVVAGRVVGGLVDRLAVLPDRILLADYKTNRVPPASVEDVPLLYLRQMAAYRAVLRAAFPGRAVSAALVWTVGAKVMELPAALLDGHAPDAA